MALAANIHDGRCSWMIQLQTFVAGLFPSASRGMWGTLERSPLSRVGRANVDVPTVGHPQPMCVLFISPLYPPVHIQHSKRPCRLNVPTVERKTFCGRDVLHTARYETDKTSNAQPRGKSRLDTSKERTIS